MHEVPQLAVRTARGQWPNWYSYTHEWTSAVTRLNSHNRSGPDRSPGVAAQVRVRCIGAEGAGHSDWSKPVSVDTPPVPGLNGSERPSATVASQVGHQGAGGRF